MQCSLQLLPQAVYTPDMFYAVLTVDLHADTMEAISEVAAVLYQEYIASTGQFI